MDQHCEDVLKSNKMFELRGAMPQSFLVLEDTFDLKHVWVSSRDMKRLLSISGGGCVVLFMRCTRYLHGLIRWRVGRDEGWWSDGSMRVALMSSFREMEKRVKQALVESGQCRVWDPVNEQFEEWLGLENRIRSLDNMDCVVGAVVVDLDSRENYCGCINERI